MGKGSIVSDTEDCLKNRESVNRGCLDLPSVFLVVRT